MLAYSTDPTEPARPIDFDPASDPECYNCDKVLGRQTELYILTRGEYFTLCVECYAKLDTLVTEVAEDDLIFKECDLCYKRILTAGNANRKWKRFHETGGISATIEMCDQCTIDDLRDAFAYAPGGIYTTYRLLGPYDGCHGRPFLFADGIAYTTQDQVFRYDTSGGLEIPKAIKRRLIPMDPYDDFDSLVQAPKCSSNMAKWMFIDKSPASFDKVPHTCGIRCGWAVRCEPGHHEVASVVQDDHCNIGMDILFPDVESFLEAEKEWNNAHPVNPDDPDDSDASYTGSFDDDADPDEECARVTTSFAVYSRCHNKLQMDYG